MAADTCYEACRFRLRFCTPLFCHRSCWCSIDHCSRQSAGGAFWAAGNTSCRWWCSACCAYCPLSPPLPTTTIASHQLLSVAKRPVTARNNSEATTNNRQQQEQQQREKDSLTTCLSVCPFPNSRRLLIATGERGLRRVQSACNDTQFGHRIVLSEGSCKSVEAVAVVDSIPQRANLRECFSVSRSWSMSNN